MYFSHLLDWFEFEDYPWNALRWVKGLRVIPIKGLLDGVKEFSVMLVVSFKRMSLLSYTFSKFSRVSRRKTSLLGHVNNKRISITKSSLWTHNLLKTWTLTVMVLNFLLKLMLITCMWCLNPQPSKFVLSFVQEEHVYSLETSMLWAMAH